MNTFTLMNVTTCYQTTEVLHDITLRVEPSQILAIVGPNGAGKSTLIKVASGVIPAISGQITLGDRDIIQMNVIDRARLIAVVPQQAKLPETFTVLEIVLMGRTPYIPMWSSESEADRDTVQKALERTGIEHLSDRPVGELSGGEQQLVVIARALAQEPQVLMLDEPTAHLDLRHQAAILELIAVIARDQHMIVVLTMHDLNQAARCAGLVALLANGTIQAQGTPSQVITAKHISTAYGLTVDVAKHPYHGTPLVTVNSIVP